MTKEERKQNQQNQRKRNQTIAQLQSQALTSSEWIEEQLAKLEEALPVVVETPKVKERYEKWYQVTRPDGSTRHYYHHYWMPPWYSLPLMTCPDCGEHEVYSAWEHRNHAMCRKTWVCAECDLDPTLYYDVTSTNWFPVEYIQQYVTRANFNRPAPWQPKAFRGWPGPRKSRNDPG